MKVLEKAIMPDGTKIQIEDWKEDYSCFDTLSIATYPITQRLPQSKKLYFHESGRPFRVDINRGWNNDEEVKKAFENLKNGKKSVKDFSGQFWDLWNAECL